jgi:hypothetical protein
VKRHSPLEISDQAGPKRDSFRPIVIKFFGIFHGHKPTRTNLRAMAEPSLQSPVELVTPVTSEGVTSLFKRIEKASHLLDETSRRNVEKLNNAAHGAMAGKSILLAQNDVLRKQNDEKKVRKSVKSKVVGTAKVMSYRDLKIAEEERDAKEAAKKVRKRQTKTKTKTKRQPGGTQVSSRGERSRSKEVDHGTREIEAQVLADYCSVLQF